MGSDIFEQTASDIFLLARENMGESVRDTEKLPVTIFKI